MRNKCAANFLSLCLLVFSTEAVHACEKFLIDQSYRASDGPGLICRFQENEIFFLFNQKLTIVHELRYLNRKIQSDCNKVKEEETTLSWYYAGSYTTYLNRQTLLWGRIRNKPAWQCEKLSRTQLITRFSNKVAKNMSENKL